LDVPFDIEFTLYNERKSVRTLHAPKIHFHLPIEVRNDMLSITREMTYLTTIFDYPVSLDPDKHEKVNLRGWASFFENEKDENACKAKLMNVAMNVLPNFMSSTLYFKDARSKRELFFGSDLRYLIYDGVRPVDTSKGML